MEPSRQGDGSSQVGQQKLHETEDDKGLVTFAQQLVGDRVSGVAKSQPALHAVDGGHEQHPKRVFGEHALLGEPEVVPHVDEGNAHRGTHEQLERAEATQAACGRGEK